MNLLGNLYNSFRIFFCLFIIFSFSEIKSQDEFYLTETDLQGYKKLSQFNSSWSISKGKSHTGIRQYWLKEGEPDTQAIYIKYCIFDSESDAINGAAYQAGNYASKYTWGSFSGSIAGDLSWTATRTIIFVRGNVGIQIGGPTTSEEDRTETLMIANIILNKIESNLSPEIISLEQAAKQKQIPLSDYHKITDPFIASETMLGFTELTSWGSKWLPDSVTLVMGRRTEWIHNSGKIIGIDICQFDTEDQAKQAAEIQSQYRYCPIFKMDSLQSMQAIINEWHSWPKTSMEEKLFSVMGTKGNLAVHIYQFDSTKINFDFMYSVVEKLAEQIINF